jgi:hypothetical protein
MKATNRITLVSLALLSLGLGYAAPAQGQMLDWARQHGTNEFDMSRGVSADSLGNVYVSGETNGTLGGASAGDKDAFLAKYDAAGTLQWTEQLGTAGIDASWGVSADSLGNVYISGETNGNLGGPSAGDKDAFLAKYDATGALQWTEQLGTAGHDTSWGVSADSLGNIYLTGYTLGSLGGPNAGKSDAFLAKYDAAGTLQWTESLGTAGIDAGYHVSANSLGDVYISGWTYGSLGGPRAGKSDAFLAKFNAAGALQWTEQLGTGDYDVSSGVSADAFGNVYISGWTTGSLGGPNAGKSDAFLAKYDAVGTLQWTEQLGTDTYDQSFGVSADGLGNVYISGTIDSFDTFLAKYDADGTLQWTEQLGAVGNDKSYGVSADSLGNVYISGTTLGSLGGPNAGGFDAFLAKYSEPTPGDANGDGKVDGLDYVAWAENYGDDPANDPPGAPGNFNDDGIVDGLDYITWAINYGQGPNDGVAVPEPGALSLLLTGMGGLIVGRRRRRG